MKQQNKFRKTSPPICSRLWRLMLLVALLLPAWEGVKGSGDNYISTDKVSISYTNLKTDGYVEITLPVYEYSGNEEGLIKGSCLSVSTDGGVNFTTVLNFWSLDEEFGTGQTADADGVIWVKSTVSKGTGFVYTYDKQNKTNVFTKIDNDESTLYDLLLTSVGTLKPGNVTFHWYIPSEYAGLPLTFSVKLLVDYQGDGASYSTFPRTFDQISTSYVGTYTTPHLSYTLSNTAGNYLVTFDGLSSSKEGSSYQWDGVNSGGVATTGSKDYAISDNARTVNFKYLPVGGIKKIKEWQ